MVRIADILDAIPVFGVQANRPSYLYKSLMDDPILFYITR
jgi:hypothetical protein